MPRCCVPGCDTGTSAEIVRTRKAKARNKSTFLLPADYKLFKKWEKVLGLKYDTSDGRSGRVCELHFNEADIIRHYYKQMEDGTINQFTFSRPTLKKGVIPLSTPREEEFSFQCQKSTRNRKKKKVPKVHNIEIKDVSKKLCGMKREHSSDDDEDDDYVPYKKPKKSSTKRASRNYEKRTYKRQIRVPRNKLISNCSQKRLPVIYNFDRFIHNMRRKNCKVPKGWEFSILDNDTVQFVCNTEPSVDFLTCTLKRETHVEIRAFNSKITMDLDFKFSSQAHLLESLVKLQKIQCCKGIFYKIFSKRCKGFILSKKKRKGLNNFGRCVVCKKVWNNILRRPSHCRVKILKRLTIPKMKFRAKLIRLLKRKMKASKKI